jgi:hypothetical protein
MSNAMSIGPAVMLNRLVDNSGTPPGAELAKIAQLRLALQQAVEQDRQKTANLDPTGEAAPIMVDSGAVVDRLI